MFLSLQIMAKSRAVDNGMVLQGLTSHSTHYRSFQRRFYRSDDLNNGVIALKVKGQSNRLSRLKGKEKDVIKNFSYI